MKERPGGLQFLSTPCLITMEMAVVNTYFKNREGHRVT